MYIIDRFEGDWAVIEGPGRITFNLPRNLLPTKAKPGDVLSITVKVDQTATKVQMSIEKLTTVPTEKLTT